MNKKEQIEVVSEGLNNTSMLDRRSIVVCHATFIHGKHLMLHNIKRLPLVALGLGYMVLFTVNSFAGEICLRPDPGGAFKFPCDGDFRNSGYCDGLKKVTVKVGEKAWQAWPYKKDKGTLIENIGAKKQLVRIRMGEKDIASFHATIGKSERQCLVRNTLYNTWMMRSCSKKTC